MTLPRCRDCLPFSSSEKKRRPTPQNAAHSAWVRLRLLRLFFIAAEMSMGL